MQQPGVSSSRVPDELDSPRAKLVYLHLSTSGWNSVQDIQHALGLKKITLFSILDTLDRQDLVECQDDAYRAPPT
jgi:DNA-binding IclR family transcriptional regulator